MRSDTVLGNRLTREIVKVKILRRFKAKSEKYLSWLWWSMAGTGASSVQKYSLELLSSFMMHCVLLSSQSNVISVNI